MTGLDVHLGGSARNLHALSLIAWGTSIVGRAITVNGNDVPVVVGRRFVGSLLFGIAVDPMETLRTD